MPTEIEIIATLDNSDTIKGLKETEREVKKTTKSLGDLEREAERLNAAFKEATFGSEKFKQLKKELITVNREIKNVELSIESLDTEQVASEVGGLVGGFSDVATGAVFAFGISQEAAEEFLLALARVEGAGRIVKGSIEGVSAGIKLYNNQIKTGALLTKIQTGALVPLGAAQRAYTVVVGASTGALKLFKAALVATGIGAIVVGIGLLIINFQAVLGWIKDTGAALFDFGKTVLSFLDPFGLFNEELDRGAQQEVENQEAMIEARKKANDEATQIHAEILERVAEERDAVKDIISLIEKRGDTDKKETTLALKQAEVRGASDKELFEIQKKANEEILRLAREEFAAKQELIRLNREQAQAELDRLEVFLNTQAIFSGFTEQQIVETRKRIEEEKAIFLANEQDRIDENRRTLDIIIADNQIFLNNRGSQAGNAAEKESDDLLKRQIAAQDKLDQFEIDRIESEQDRRDAQARFDFDKRIANLNENIPQEAELIKQFEIQLLDDLAAIRDEFDQKELDQKFDQSQRLSELRLEILEGTRVDEVEQFALDTDISNQRFEFELTQLRFELDQKQITEDEFNLQQQLLEQQHEGELNRIAEDGAEFRKQQAIDEANVKIDNIARGLNQAATLNKSFNEIADNLRKDGEKQSVKSQKNRFNINKAFNIASVIIDGAKAAVAGIAQFGPPPSPAGIASLVSAGAITAAQIAAIASQKFNASGGGGGGGGGGTLGFTPTTTGAGGAQAAIPTTSTGGTNVITQGQEAGANQQAGAAFAPLKAFVLTNEIGDALDASVAIESQSEL